MKDKHTGTICLYENDGTSLLKVQFKTLNKQHLASFLVTLITGLVGALSKEKGDKNTIVVSTAVYLKIQKNKTLGYVIKTQVPRWSITKQIY